MKRSGRERLTELIRDVPGPAARRRLVAGFPDLAREDGQGVLPENPGLPDDLREDRRRDGSGLDEVAEQVPRADRWELVVVPEEDDRRPVEVDRTKELPGEG